MKVRVQPLETGSWMAEVYEVGFPAMYAISHTKKEAIQKLQTQYNKRKAEEDAFWERMKQQEILEVDW